MICAFCMTEEIDNLSSSENSFVIIPSPGNSLTSHHSHIEVDVIIFFN